jgi:DNA-directed RNA polymerase subunit beta'
MLAHAQQQAQEIEELYHSGMIADTERKRQLVELWTETTELVSKQQEARLHPYGTLATIINSGATKAKFQQIRQLAGIRGLIAAPGGRIIPIPILGNYLEGLAVWEEFLAARGGRDSQMAKSLGTPTTGYLTRRLVEVGQEVWITEEDCGTEEAMTITNQESRALLGLPDMSSRIAGRILAEPAGTLPAGMLLDKALADQLVACNLSYVRVRSPLACHARYGICRACYGRDPATGALVRKGLAVGVIAGQSIGEPGTQLSMRVFHTGGIAGAQGDIRAGLPRIIELFEAQVPKDRAEISKIAGRVEIEKGAANDALNLRIVPAEPSFETYSHAIAPHRRLVVEQGQWVEAGAALTTGSIDPAELLETLGCQAAARYLVCEVQRVFRGTGVYINEKHIEIIVRQMLRYVLVVDPGDTMVLPGEILDRFALETLSGRVLAEGGNPARAKPVLLGLTKVALRASSWVAAAAFQNTRQVLAEAAIAGRTDNLDGLQARIVVGKPIPRQTK